MTGHFIVFEGPDGSGTSKHSQLLADRMQKEGYNVLLTTEPTEGVIGQEIRSLLNSDNMPPPDAVQLLFTADRAQHVKEIVNPALESGKTVISDRYALSTFIYGVALGLDEQWLKDLNRKFPEPDLTIVTLPSLETCIERIGKRETTDQFENALFQKQIYEGYRGIEDPTTIFIDTTPEKEIVAEEIWNEVQKYFDPISRKTLAELQ